MRTAQVAASGQMSGVDWLLLMLLSGLWGGSFFFFKVLVASLPVFTIVLARVVVAALVLHLVLLARREPMPRESATWGAFFVMGCLNNVVPFALLIFGETRIPSGLASILNATTPMFTVLVAQVFIAAERMTVTKLAGIGAGFFGVVLLMSSDVLSGTGGGDIVGEAACLLAAVSYGFANVFGRRFHALAPLKVATGQLTASACMTLPLSLVFDHPWTLTVPAAGTVAALVGLAVPCTAFAYMIFFGILGRAGATNVSLVTLLVPVSALLLGALALGESLTGATYAGMALIGVGLLCIDGRVLTRLRRPASA